MASFGQTADLGLKLRPWFGAAPARPPALLREDAGLVLLEDGASVLLLEA